MGFNGGRGLAKEGDGGRRQRDYL
ncbi:hypothetical protein CCACVL1_24397 [Corchorus capsularis]|uniref:Uncharacterized protein n=1 Tax=Corchorus capsularis TaxID=210143 RepID=A0A1R3GPR8_COCAP|nr:hypothetical protein CCACVL1_24397 [Corchorus capsularis]